ncbi:tubulin polyglutamylase TTLL11 isoform X2 [Erinaceus europaeus]|uniref:Tubulin polyglutamylase TTLL11 isoform X2 n=1 Tax=Erinaceus europaeus TaxID=9365 RepID=A0A1S3W3I5_ERIEU|nr:tubulin polyglutamylase TTLL11 isoform X2 [Erinaceus europaeus]
MPANLRSSPAPRGTWRARGWERCHRWAVLRRLSPSSKRAASASVTGLVTWACAPMRSLGLGPQLSLPGPYPEAAPASVNWSLSDHGNGLGRGARGSGGGCSSLFAGPGGGAAAAAVAPELAPALSTMLRDSSGSELAVRWEARAAAAQAKAQAARQLRVDAGAAGEPERSAREPQSRDSAPTSARGAEEGDGRGPSRPPPMLPQARQKLEAALGSCSRAKPRSKGQSSRRGVGRQSDERGPKRPVTVDSSKAKTSLEALKISIRQLKWKEFPFGRRLPCDIYWHGVSFHDNDIFCGQVNKFPGMTEMVRKITLSRAVRIMQNLFPEEYNFYPRSWILPDEFQLFVAQVQMVKDGDPSWKPTFIVKPDSGCQGDGIYLVKDPSDIRLAGTLQSRPAVVQEYICKPLLIDKLKFDIRLYVLLKSLDPLEIYIAKDGLSRFCTEPYQEPNSKNLHHIFMHLTNYSLNIHSGNFVHSDSASTGSKRTFSSILCRLSSKGVDIKKVWSDIISLVIKTVIALTPELKVFYQSDIPAGRPGPTCFQILGFDILLMKNLKPMLLEVNANPSMRIEHEQELSPGVFENVPSLVDEEVKVAVIRDTLRLMDPLKKKREAQSKQPEKPLAAKEDHPNSEQASTSESNTEAHLPSICLKQVFPKYAKQFNYLRLVDRMANLFIRFLGIKGTMKLGPTGFRTFIRNCKLSSGNLTMASVDILYIDITRRWNSMTLDQRDSGMCLQAFVEAFFYLADKKFKTRPLHEQVASLIDLCEYHLSLLDEKRLVCGRSGTSTGRPLHSSTPLEGTSSIPLAGGNPPPCAHSTDKSSDSKYAVP